MSFATPVVWVFNVWGAADLLFAFYQGFGSSLTPACSVPRSSFRRRSCRPYLSCMV